MHFQNPAQQMSVPAGEGPLILPFSAIDAAILALVGGKAANLGVLTLGGFPVPEGFCVTTNAYALITVGSVLSLYSINSLLLVAMIQPAYKVMPPTARASLLAAPIPDNIVEAITGAYAALERGAKRILLP